MKGFAMFTHRALLSSTASAALLMVCVASSANGAYVPLTGTNWEYETTPGVTFTLTGGTGQTTGDPWLVTESYWNPPSDDPIVTSWRQTTAPVDGGDNYFAISLERANICEWTSYTWTITDDNGVEQTGGSHPEAAHFHTGPMTQYAPFTTLAPQGTGGNGVYSITVSDGPLPENSFWNAGVLKVHDYDNLGKETGQPGNTAFTITETPTPNCVPEPGTVGMLAAGFLGFAIVAFRPVRRAKVT